MAVIIHCESDDCRHTTPASSAPGWLALERTDPVFVSASDPLGDDVAHFCGFACLSTWAGEVADSEQRRFGGMRKGRLCSGMDD